MPPPIFCTKASALYSWETASGSHLEPNDFYLSKHVGTMGNLVAHPQTDQKWKIRLDEIRYVEALCKLENSIEIEGHDKGRRGAARDQMCWQQQKGYISTYSMEEMRSTAPQERKQENPKKQTPEYITTWGLLVWGQTAQHMLCGPVARICDFPYLGLGLNPGQGTLCP